ncbi:MAG TPA: hypothetical protein VF784_13235 [Anaerolineales bacterium]
MAPKTFRSLLIATSIAFVLAILPASAHADTALPDTTLPTLTTFTSWLSNGQAGLLRGVYVPGILADGVVQQPAGRGDYVSPRQGYVTQFGAASALGSTGLLAHNYLAGATFSLMQAGQLVYLVYGDGKTVTFMVTQRLQYQALQPNSPYSNFIDPGSHRSMTASQVFSTAYGHPGAVVFQTCIAANGVDSWGRLFVIAEPYTYRARPNAQ